MLIFLSVKCWVILKQIFILKWIWSKLGIWSNLTSWQRKGRKLDGFWCYTFTLPIKTNYLILGLPFLQFTFIPLVMIFNEKSLLCLVQTIWCPCVRERKRTTFNKAEGFYYHIVNEQMASVNTKKHKGVWKESLAIALWVCCQNNKAAFYECWL